jgi:hypothetical protein
MRRFWNRNKRSGGRVETRDELGERYLRELEQLVIEGEISASLARRVRADLFDRAEPGKAPQLRRDVWQAYLDEGGGESVVLQFPSGGKDSRRP